MASSSARRLTLFFAVPTQYQQLLDVAELRSDELQSLRFLHERRRAPAGADHPGVEAVHSVPFKQGFGMTEFGPGMLQHGPGVRHRQGGLHRPAQLLHRRAARG